MSTTPAQAQSSAQPDWAVQVDGAVYARPVAAGSQVIVATENNSVYALDGATGAVVWQQNLGQPVPASQLPCGNIDPVGITSTPAVDAATGVVYVSALLQPTHDELIALDLASGSVLWRVPDDAPGADPRVHGQRGALKLTAGRVVVPYGGRNGDCGDYHGTLVSFPVSRDGAGLMSVYRTPAQEAGMWAPSGPTADADGNLYVATGNGESGGSYAYGESVLKLSPDLHLLDAWAPANWQQLDRGDVDIGSISPTLIGSGLVFQTGKNGMGYLLNSSALGGVGGEAFSARACPSAAFGAATYVAPLLYVPCNNAVVALQVDASGPSFSQAWTGPAESSRPAAGPPVVAGGLVWSIDNGRRVLYGLDASNGQTRFLASLPGAEHFATPAVSGTQVFVPAGKTILAFSPPQLAPTPAPEPPSGATCGFAFGFADLQARLGGTMGTPTSCEFADPAGTGDTEQTTTTGLAFWRKSTNTPTFTDGYNHWALTPVGLVTWTGNSIDPPG